VSTDVQQASMIDFSPEKFNMFGLWPNELLFNVYIVHYDLTSDLKFKTVDFYKSRNLCEYDLYSSKLEVELKNKVPGVYFINIESETNISKAQYRIQRIINIVINSLS